MCLIGIRLQDRGDPVFQIAANRDEFADRPTAALHWWEEGILAGRDLKAGGTWLGISRSGRFAAVTNVRDPSIKDNPCPRPSRGHLVTEFLQGDAAPERFVRSLLQSLCAPSPFNLLVGQIGHDQSTLWWLGGRHRTIEKLAPGVHTLSNAELNTPWPKALALQRAMESGAAEEIELSLQSKDPVSDDQLPSTGVSLDWERTLSAPMITGADYRTRSSTILTLASGVVHVKETTWGPDGQAVGVAQDRFPLLSLELGASERLC
jgi:uncharacterized protein with NRDE domain